MVPNLAAHEAGSRSGMGPTAWLIEVGTGYGIELALITLSLDPAAVRARLRHDWSPLGVRCAPGRHRRRFIPDGYNDLTAPPMIGATPRAVRASAR